MNDYTFELLTAIPENLLKYMKEKMLMIGCI